MGTCMARKGFLTLSDCGNPAVTSCSTCARPMCTMHLAPQSGFTQCLDCAARDPNVKPQADDDYDGVWAHRYRNDYYSSSSYRPYYYGSSYSDTYYDDQDVRSFDDDVNGQAALEDDTETGGFQAS